MNSFYPHAVKIWNELDPDLRQATSLSNFKSNILKIIRPPKKNVLNIYDPKGMKRLFQLRVGLSPLRNHKNRHKFNDNPTDTCCCLMAAETTAHFLLYCDLFTEARGIMNRVINPIMASNGLILPSDDEFVNFLLYGHKTLSADDNTAVLTALLKYIHETTRFELTTE